MFPKPGGSRPHAVPAIAALSIALVTLLSPLNAASANEPVPRVRAAPTGQHGFPFMSSSMDLSARQFVEKEFLFSGTAQAYVDKGPWGENGRWNAKPNPGVTAPYTLRMLVRRPSNPARFNGTVIVEWLNVTAGHDLPQDWGYLNEELMREGYAYVGITAQHIGGLALQDWEDGPGDRYATIFHPGDTFAFDIFTQAGRAIKTPRAGNPKPLGDLTRHIKIVLADGESQSAHFMFTYYNSIHRLAQFYDGFLIHSTGHGNPLSMDTANLRGDPIPDGVPATDWIETPWPAGLRTDLETPVMVVLAEIDNVFGSTYSLHPQPDSKYLRIWEIAGAAHNDAVVTGVMGADREKSMPGSVQLHCDAPPMNTGDTHAYVMRAAVHALSRWARAGVLPSKGPRLKFDIEEDIIKIDPATGIAKGGIRLPEVAVPVATLWGDRPAASNSPPTCFFLLGAYDPWNRDGDSWDGQADMDPSPTPEPDLQLLYDGRKDYLRKVAIATHDSTLRGFLRPRDAITVLRDASKVNFP